MDWFRWYHDTTFDPKFRVVAKRSGSRLTDVIAVWAVLLERASSAEERGDIAGVDTLAIDAGLDLEDGSTDNILQELTARGMISCGRISAWEKRQVAREREDNSAERVRAYRERQKSAGNASVTPCNASVTPGNTQIRLDKKREELKSKHFDHPSADRRFDDDEKSEQPEPVTPPKADAAKPKRTSHNDDFDAFWQAYPRKTAKANAKKAWDKLAKSRSLPSIDTLIAAVESAKGSDQWAKDGGQFIPHPATWLNQARWEDEHDAEPEWVQPVATQEEIDRIQARRQAERDRELAIAIEKFGPVRYDPKALDLFAPPPELQTKRH